MASSDEIQQIPVDELHFDARNPRILSEADGRSQEAILSALWNSFAVDELVESISANGFFEFEPLYAAIEKGQLVVVEGNRRLAAVRILRDPSLARRLSAKVPKISAAARRRLDTLPVVVRDRDKIWQFIGFKHVNGPQMWQSLAKAEYIAWVRNELGVALEEVARTIGDRNATVRRLYRALMALEQAESAGIFDREDRARTHFSFSHLYTGLDYPGISAHVGVSGERSYRKSPVPTAKLKNFGELCV